VLLRFQYFRHPWRSRRNDTSFDCHARGGGHPELYKPSPRQRGFKRHKLSAASALANVVPYYTSNGGTTNRSNATLIAQHRSRESADSGAARGAFLLGRHGGTAGQGK